MFLKNGLSETIQTITPLFGSQKPLVERAPGSKGRNEIARGRALTHATAGNNRLPRVRRFNHGRNEIARGRALTQFPFTIAIWLLQRRNEIARGRALTHFWVYFTKLRGTVEMKSPEAGH